MNTKPKKICIEVRESVDPYRLGVLGVELEAVKEYVSALINKYGPLASLEINHDDLNGSIEATVLYKRKETDKEYDLRIIRENCEALNKARAAEAQKKARHKAYLRLKKEFEGK